MAITAGWLRSISVHRVDHESFHGYAVADWGGWIPGAHSKTRIGGYFAAIRARIDGRI